MIQKKTVKRSGLLALAMIMALGIWSAVVYADETDAGSVSLNITAGEHGTVNGHTGSFTETVTSGSDLILDCQADEGYVIGSVIVNDAEVESEDLSGILQQLKGKLTLEELTTDLSLTVNFTESGTDPVAPSEDESGADIGAGDTEDTSDTDTDISDAGAEGADNDNDEDPADIDLGDDEATDAEIQETGSEDEPGSLSTGEDTTEEIDLDDSGETGGEEVQPGQTEPEVTDDEDATAEEDTGKTEEEKPEATEEHAKEKTDDKVKSEEKQEGKGDDDTYVSDESPKTGDAFHMPVILAMLASLCTLAGIAIRQLLRKRHEEV